MIFRDCLVIFSASNLVVLIMKENSMLRHYRQQGCQFECRLRNSAKKAGCVPWDYPLPTNISEIICRNSEGEDDKERSLEAFDAFMKSQESLRGCQCLPNCEEVAYETQVISCIPGDNYFIFDIYLLLRLLT